jgi:hypothetical protein
LASHVLPLAAARGIDRVGESAARDKHGMQICIQGSDLPGVAAALLGVVAAQSADAVQWASRYLKQVLFPAPAATGKITCYAAVGGGRAVEDPCAGEQDH